MNQLKCLLTLFTAGAALFCFAELAPVKVEGKKLVADGKELRLRGINWGWWHLSGTHYTENDMRQQAEWGANMLRLAMSYTDIVTKDGKWNEAAFAKVDEVVQWAKKYNQYVILDLHVAPGGQDPALYCDGGNNLIWKEKAKQELYFYIWRELAKRYRRNPVVAAYEVMNEPCTQRPDPDLLVELNEKVVAEIRKVDPDKVIVISGDQWGNARDLKGEVKLDDGNILYTFHFYEGGSPNGWIRNLGESQALSGTQEWTRFELAFKSSPNTNQVRILLRSEENRGSAWFDDVTLTNEDGYVMQKFSFDKDADQFKTENASAKGTAFDPETGHGKPGSLRLSGTSGEYGWIGPARAIHPGQTYKIGGWIKLEKATGKTYIGAALYGNNSTQIDTADLRERIKPAVEFADYYKVPLWVGEFSAVRNSGPEGFQAASVAERIRLFEEHGISWTYWNFHETTGPHGMALQAQKRGKGAHPVNEPLLKVLKDGWSLNRKD